MRQDRWQDFLLRYRCNMDRQPDAFWNADGSPIGIERRMRDAVDREDRLHVTDLDGPAAEIARDGLALGGRRIIDLRIMGEQKIGRITIDP